MGWLWLVVNRFFFVEEIQDVDEVEEVKEVEGNREGMIACMEEVALCVNKFETLSEEENVVEVDVYKDYYSDPGTNNQCETNVAERAAVQVRKSRRAKAHPLRLDL